MLRPYTDYVYKKIKKIFAFVSDIDFPNRIKGRRIKKEMIMIQKEETKMKGRMKKTIAVTGALAIMFGGGMVFGAYNTSNADAADNGAVKDILTEAAVNADCPYDGESPYDGEGVQNGQGQQNGNGSAGVQQTADQSSDDQVTASGSDNSWECPRYEDCPYDGECPRYEDCPYDGEGPQDGTGMQYGNRGAGNGNGNGAGSANGNGNGCGSGNGHGNGNGCGMRCR